MTQDAEVAAELVAPTVELWRAWSRSHEEWGPGSHEDGFGLVPTDAVADFVGFSDWVGRLHRADDQCTYRWIVDVDQDVLGAIALRHHDDHFGHVGYGIRPSARGRGLATWALGQMLDYAWDIGFREVVAVCAEGNEPSCRVIEHNGGVLVAIIDTEHGRARRYVTRDSHAPTIASSGWSKSR